MTKLNVVRRRSGRERMAKESCVGEMVRATGVDLVCGTSAVSAGGCEERRGAHLLELVQARLRL